MGVLFWVGLCLLVMLVGGVAGFCVDDCLVILVKTRSHLGVPILAAAEPQTAPAVPTSCGEHRGRLSSLEG